MMTDLVEAPVCSECEGSGYGGDSGHVYNSQEEYDGVAEHVCRQCPVPCPSCGGSGLGRFPTIPPVPAPPKHASVLVLDVADHHRILFALGGRAPTERQWHGMRRHIESELRRYHTEYGETFETVAWRWER